MGSFNFFQNVEYSLRFVDWIGFHRLFFLEYILIITTKAIFKFKKRQYNMIPKNNNNKSVQDIFICYNSDDTNEVNEIIKFLNENDFSVSYDDDFLPGKQFTKLFSKNLKQIRIAIICYGGEIGKWQEAEIPAFINEKKDRGILIIPIILENSDEKNIDSLISDVIRVDLNKNKKNELNRLKRSVDEFLSFNNIKKVENVDTKEYYNLATKHEYEELLIEINKLRKHDLVDNPGKLPQSVFYIELEDKLSELSQKKFNCVIIHGPQLTGKKTLVSNYISSQPKKYVIPYDGTKMDLSLTNKRSTEHIFASWLRAIYTSLVNRHKDNPAVLNVLNEYKDEIVNHRLEAYKKIADKIKMGVSAKYYTGFDILNVYFTELFREANIVVNDKTKIIIEFAIRNFQKMFTDTLYKNFMEELKKYIQSDNDKKNSFIEFIIISRYIHPSIIYELGEQKIVVNTRFLKLEELGKMLSPLIVIEKITKSEDFINRFFFYTNGQPYFSIKLIYLYISVRLKDEVKLPPEELLEHIFNIEDYWIYYGNEHDNAQCSFRHNISEIKNFYKKRNKTKVDKYVEILSFLSNSDNKLNDILEEINNEESANNDFYANDILVSTGIFNYKFVGDLYEAVSFGNPIIEKHIVAELVKHYKQ